MENILTGAVKQSVAQKLQCRNLPDWSLFSIVQHNNKKPFQFIYYCLLVVLVFEFIVCFDGNFINDDPPVQVSQSCIVLFGHYIESRQIRFFRETLIVSLIDQFSLLSRAPPA